MVKKTYKVEYEEGIHLRPAGLILKVAQKYDCKTKLVFKGKDYEATSIIKMVSACIKCGEKCEVVCDGPDEMKCMTEIDLLFQKNFE